MLAKSLPAWVSCESEIVYPADPGFSFVASDVARRYDGVAWTGSSLTVYADTPAVKAQIELCKAVFKHKIPQFGRCVPTWRRFRTRLWLAAAATAASRVRLVRTLNNTCCLIMMVCLVP